MIRNYQNNQRTHDPVLLGEVVREFELNNAPLQPSTKKIFIDGTVGLAGHSVEIVKSGAFVLGIDMDREYLEIARKRLMDACPGTYDSVSTSQMSRSQPLRECFALVHGNFKDIDSIAHKHGIYHVDGILLDLGVNTPQLTSKTRGLSFQNKLAPLDMRLDPENQGVTAADLLNGLNRKSLVELFSTSMKVHLARKTAQAIVATRQRGTLKTVGDLLAAVRHIRMRSEKINPATLIFMALRIAVNCELESLKTGLERAFPLLNVNGKLLVISFHSGEDRIVKNYFKSLKEAGKADVSDKPIVPSDKEIQRNSRARSAKLRIAIKKHD